MSLADAGRAVEVFLEVIEEGQQMARAGKVGAEFDDLRMDDTEEARNAAREGWRLAPQPCGIGERLVCR